MTINERIKMIRVDLGLSQQDFADKVHISKSSIQNYENPLYTQPPKDSAITNICTNCGVRRQWLLYEEGPRYRPEDQFETVVKHLWPDATPRVIEFLKRVNEVPGGMDRLVETLDSLMPFINKKPEA